MKNALYFKFVLAYVLLAILGLILISTAGSAVIQRKILDNTGEELYREATSLSYSQASQDYDSTTDLKEIYDICLALADYESARILLINPRGELYFVTGSCFQDS